MLRLHDVLRDYININDFSSLYFLCMTKGWFKDIRELKNYMDRDFMPIVVKEINERLLKSANELDTFCTNMVVQKDTEYINIKILGLNLPRKYSSKKDFYQKFRKYYQDEVRSIILSCYPDNNIPYYIKIIDNINGESVYYNSHTDNIEDVMEKMVIHEVEEAFLNVDLETIFNRCEYSNTCL